MRILSLVFFIFGIGCSSLSKKYSYDVKKDFTFQGGSFDIYRPRTQQKAPVVLVIHGGGWDSRRGDMASICKDLAGQGFLVLNLTYRLAPAHLYPAAIDDVRAALEYIRTNAEKFNADPDQIYTWGYSAGGHLALLLGFTSGDKIKGIVAGAAPSTLVDFPGSPIIKKFLGKTIEEDRELWVKASPITYVTPKSPPVFMYHAKKDHLVYVEQSRKMKIKLEENHVPVTLKEVGGGLGHIGVYLLSQSSVDEGVNFLKALARSAQDRHN